MAMINGVFVNLGCCGYYESAGGVGGTSLSGYRNFGNHPWPQMDIGNINFHNPRTCTDETVRNRTLTRNQAIWLTNQITNFINGLDIPNEDEFDNREDGRLKEAPSSVPAFDDAGYSALHSLEASLTELIRDHPEWTRAYDHHVLVKARALLVGHKKPESVSS